MRFEIAKKLPRNWSYLSIDDVCLQVTSGGTPSRRNANFYENGKIFWVKTKELSDSFIKQTEETITEEAIKKSSAKLLPANTVLMAMYGATVGKLGILENEMACNQACCALIVDPSIADYRYLFYLLANQRGKIQSLATGAAQQNLSSKQIKQFEFPFPPIEVQRKVAEIIGSIDKKIQLNHQINQTLEQMAQAIFKSWFVDFEPVKAKMEAKKRWHALQPGNEPASPVCYAGEPQPLPDLETYMNLAAMQAISGKTPEQLACMEREQPDQYARLRATAELFPSAMQPSELGDIPEGWEVVCLAHLASTITKGTTPRKSEVASAKDPATIPFIKVKDISGTGEIIQQCLDHIPRSIHSGFLKRSILESGDILFSIAGTIGRIAIVNADLDGANTNQAVGIIRIKEKSMHLPIIWQTLKSERVQNDISSKIVQGVQANVSLANLRDIKIIMPTTKLLEKTAEAHGEILNKIITNQKQIRLLGQIRDTLLPKLLSGEITVPEAEAQLATTGEVQA
ncbi:restriction endonuclease subunit S [Microbulbifer thermotolerans]|uniref:restriction endonuclease subunit S n=1 Tax=Microbulbifer thermotolerans TaxID=252514 RepID=UPI00224AA2A2|nr:restriction endonuclease subunit S [Microbulbifer thermotolerans]MCX2778622.1 restriction endonuclease subunit S [Microbulbifer thermotolerans]MCX2803869.1 restriction endonuclease subunit S [Microbulbifer thermotolerans]